MSRTTQADMVTLRAMALVGSFPTRHLRLREQPSGEEMSRRRRNAEQRQAPDHKSDRNGHDEPPGKT
jgi:hypothetical protein